MRFSSDDVLRFAAWSADRNPLHVDEEHARQTHFGQRVVHGVLTVLESLRSAGPAIAPRLVRALDIEFRNAVIIGAEYQSRAQAEGDDVVVTLEGGGQLVLSVRAETAAAGPLPETDLSWLPSATARGVRDTPAAHAVEDLHRGVEATGLYPSREAWADSVLSPTQARVLGLCSYVTGMEVPGLKSLFTRITLRFHADADASSDLRYRAWTIRFDRQFRLLDTELQVATSAGTVIATGLLRSYVPFSPSVTDVEELQHRLVPEAERLRDKVALVVGGSRGLGADLTASLALAGCHVYVSARHDDAARQQGHQSLTGRGAPVEFLQGDAGDAEWCASALEAIVARHGRLDLLVLNACAPPTSLRVDAASAARRAQYVRDNLRLVETPLAACASALGDSSGAVICVSSSFVQETPPGFGHYVAVKQAAEGMVRTVSRERPQVHALIVRPPVLQTRWNDTPAGVLGAIPADWAASHAVNRLAERWGTREADLLTEFPPFEARRETSALVPDFTVRLAASYTTDPLVPALSFWLKELEVNGAVEVAPYGQVLQSLLDPGSILNARGRGFNVVLVRVGDWLRELPEEQAVDIEFVRPYLQEMSRDLERAVRAHRAQGQAETLLLISPSHGAQSAAEGMLVRQTEGAMAASLSGVPGLQVVFAREYHGHYAVDEDQVHDPLRDEIAHIPYRDEYLHVLAAIVARHLHRRLAPVRKVVVVDCDNTLWRGVVGEVGAEGVEFDESHWALHRTLQRLTQSGVLVCLCSKNEEPDVWRVFDTREELRLRRDQVVAATINWLPKSQNLRVLAGRLNLGLDSFVFIDDNPVECAEVRAGCPEVLTVQWPHEPGRGLRLLQHLWEFDAGKATKEDERRTELYREEFRRQELRAETLTFEDFIQNLQLAVEFSPLAPDDLRRSAQLTLRTNQFNFTTIRREEADLQALVAGGRHEIRTIRVRDRFGDYGLVGLFIAERGERVWTLDTFLLSCRVLGRGVEHRIVSDLGQMAAAAGASAVKLRVETTKRNTPARSFLESIVPEGTGHRDEGVFECELPADVLAAIRFEPSAGEVVVQDDSAPKAGASAPLDADGLRRREQQIARAAFDLGTGAELRAAIEGRPAPAPDVQAAGSEEDVAAVVRAAFAAALRITPERVAAVDRLETLGCDSLRIVEITVALSEMFPKLPSTLLFEHRSVSQIVKEIVRLSRSQAPATTEPEAVVSVDARRGGPLGPPANAAGIAVVGLNLRCAGADSPEELWNLLSAGRSAVALVPRDRRYFMQPLQDARAHWAGLLADPARFDAEIFGVSPREAEQMDPQLRLFLEVAWGALEDAGCAGVSLEPETGVFAGVMYGDYGFRANLAAAESGNVYRSWEGFSLANRLSQLLGFHGPSLAVDTACSSSGTALHLACASLRAGECRVAIVGGVNLILDSDRFGSLGRLGILSARGQCEPFGADADGTVLGEGAGVVVLRPLDEAVKRGDRVYGVIKGTGLSTGSGTVGFTAPNPQAQAEAIRRTVQTARIDPRTISYVETHGTGTALGDPIEVRGLTLAYGDSSLHDPSLAIVPRCTLGSIKPNIGHLEAGAGALGLIKVLLQFQHRQLLPSTTSSRPNPQIPFDQGPFDVQRELAEWPATVAIVNGTPVTLPRRAGLSSFGVGGANAHVIVEEFERSQAPSPDMRRGGPSGPPAVPGRPLHLLTLSARGDAPLRAQARRLAEHLEAHPDAAIADLCFTLNTGRRHFEDRLAVTAATPQELQRALAGAAEGHDLRGGARGTASPGSAPKVAFLFTGQGSQYAGMGRELYETQPVFRAALDRCAAIVDTLLDRPLFDLLFARDGTPEAGLLHQTGYTQPALFAFEYALSRVWQSWGIAPHIVMGHSVGEIAAMCVAGGVSLEDGLKLIAARGRLMQALPAGGVMTSVMADETRVLEALAGLEDMVAIAAINAPDQVVISGAGVAVAEIAARLTADGIKTKVLTVSHAFHSPLMKPMLAEYERVVRTIRFSAPHVPIVSCVDGALASAEMTRPEYWIRQVLEPVRFTAGVAALDAQRVSAYVEIGPHPVLLGMARQCVADDSELEWLPSLRKDADAWATLLGSVARLYIRGTEIDWDAFDEPYRRRRVPAPAYAFTRKQYWLRHSSAPRSFENGDSDISPVEPDLQAGPHRARRYEIAWRRSDEQSTPDIARHHWVILADRGGVGVELAKAIGARGAATTLVAAGGSLEASMIELPSARVVHLRGLDAMDSGAVDAAVASAVHVIQAVARTRSAERAIWIVTQGATAAEAPSSPAPISVAQAPLWGLARTAALEHPDIWGGVIDVPRGDARSVAEALARELLLRADDEDQVALVGDERYVPRLVPCEPPAAASASRRAVAEDGTYLVTGGLGALGLHAARWLVENGARRIVLASRRTADPQAAAAIEALKQAGAHVSVVSADVSRAGDVDALLAVIAGSGHPLRGVIHAAGVDTLTPLARMSDADVHAALGAKVTGAWLLHERTRDLPLGLFVCFSSVASILGAQGRAHYAAANAFLDALALERQRVGLPATSINWGPWKGGGMATAEHLEQFERVGNYGLDPEDALRALSSIVGDRVPNAIVADIDWGRFAPVYEARRSRPVLNELALRSTRPMADVPGAEAGLQPRPGRPEGRPLRSPTPAGGGGRAPWIEALCALPAPGREAALADLLRREVAETLGFDDPASVPLDRSFYDIGMDSLLMADLVSRLKKRAGMSFTALVFDHPDVRSLASRMLEKLPLDGASAPAGQTAPAEAGREVRPDGRSAVEADLKVRLDSRPTGPALEEEILAFQTREWPHRSPELIPSRWRWMFIESARRLGVEPRVWLRRDGDQIVANMGSIPVRLKIGDALRDTGWLVDTMVSSGYRSQALGARLMVEAREDQPFSLSLGQTAEMREIQFRLGWKEIAPLQIARLLVRPENVLKGKLPAPAAWAAGLGFRASSAFRGRRGDRSWLDVRAIGRFDERHDRLWALASRDLTCAVVRDASYLNWKYVDQPGQQFLRLDVIDEAGVVKGVAVWMFREPDTHYRYRRAHLVDLVTPLADPAGIQAIIRTACAAAAEAGADALLCLHINACLTRALRACGFQLRTPERVLLVDPGPLSGLELERVLSPEGWFVTQGDSDIDRPW